MPDLCNGQRKGGQGPCTRPAGWGTPHPGIGRCKFHGGSTPSHVIAARNEQAAQAVATYGLPRVLDPHDALVEELHRTAGHVAWLGALIADLEERELKQYAPGGSAKDEDGEDHALLWEKPAIWLELYQRERRHLADVAKTCIAVGIEERRVRIVEQAGEQIASVLRRFAAALGLALDDPSVQQAARRALLAEGGVVDGTVESEREERHA